MKKKNTSTSELLRDQKSAAHNVSNLTQKAMSKFSFPKIVIADNGKGFAVNGQREFLGGSHDQ